MISLILTIAAAGFGALVSAGVLTVLISVGLIPRFIQRTGTACKELMYENFIVLGTILGCLFSVFPPELNLGKEIGGGLLAFCGFFGGIFEGCVAIAVAEMLDALPIFQRRAEKRMSNQMKGIRPFIAAVALGKLAGSLWYFYNGIYRYGG